MARANNLSVTIRVADMASVKLFVWSLRLLEHEMRVGADPFAERLGKILDRVTALPRDPNDPDEGPAQ